jgi:hypothetical protein
MAAGGRGREPDDGRSRAGAAAARIGDALIRQAAACARLGSPFTAALLRDSAADFATGGVVRDLLGDWPGDPAADAMPLRLAGALHALALLRRDDALMAAYADPAQPPPWQAIEGALRAHDAFVRDWLRRPPQTNEVRRSLPLLLGWFAAARVHPVLHVREIGASAGLNLLADRWSYDLGGTQWGGGGVRIAAEWIGPPAAPMAFTIASRAGCDADPLDPRHPGSRLALRAYVWPDQPERLARLAAALDVAAADPPRVDRADAADWLERELADRPDGHMVVQHSVVWQYLPAATQARITALMDWHGAQATQAAPLSWLQFELEQDGHGRGVLTLRTWPGGEARVLAHPDPHVRTLRHASA